MGAVQRGKISARAAFSALLAVAGVGVLEGIGQGGMEEVRGGEERRTAGAKRQQKHLNA